MAIHESQLTLYQATVDRFAEITAKTPKYPERGRFLSVLDECVQVFPFHDPNSIFPVDNAGLTGIEMLQPHVYTLCLDFYKNSLQVVRAGRRDKTEYLVVLAGEILPTLLHYKDFSDTRTSKPSILHKLYRRGRAEILGPERAIHLHNALNNLSVEQIEIDESV